MAQTPNANDIADLFDRAAIKLLQEGRVRVLSDALVKAARAVQAPDVEVRFICKRTEDLLFASEAIMQALTETIDRPMTAASAADALLMKTEPVIEFKNGSCIRFCFETTR